MSVTISEALLSKFSKLIRFSEKGLFAANRLTSFTNIIFDIEKTFYDYLNGLGELLELIQKALMADRTLEFVLKVSY